MPTINGKACVVDGKAVDKVFSNGVQVYGRNLLTGTSSDLQTAPDSHYKAVGGIIYTPTMDERRILAGNQVTARVFIHNTTTHAVNLIIWTNIDGFGVGTDVPAGTDGFSTITAYNISSTIKSIDINIRAYAENASINGVQYKELKMEKGSVATPWTPAPEDVGV